MREADWDCSGRLPFTPPRLKQSGRTLPNMSRYYDDEEDDYPGAYQNGHYLSPDTATRPLDRNRRRSKDAREEERPRLQRNYTSDNDAIDYPADFTEEWDENGHLGWARSSKQVPLPTRSDRAWDPSILYPDMNIRDNQSSRNDGEHRGRSSHAKQVPSPPPPMSRRGSHGSPAYADPTGSRPAKKKHVGKIEPSRDTSLYPKRLPSPPGPSIPFRLSPPMPPTVLPFIIQPSPPLPPRRKKSISLTKRVPSPPALSYRRHSPNTSYSKKRPSRQQVPSPPGINRRRHSDMDVTSTRLERHDDTTPAGHKAGRYQPLYSVQRDKRPNRGDRAPSLQVPLSIPGSFPSALDAIQPEDSRSETSPSGKRLSSRDTQSLVSGSSLRPSVSPSLSGVLGENIYRYKPLGEFEFRLVRILPKTMTLVKCELVHCSLEDPPSYIAISYAWGDTDDRRRIQLEGADIPTSASLHGALSALRAKKESVLVWVDALSIDQQNKDERTQQVQLMTNIYSRGVSVAIWLGHEADSSDTAIKTLSEVAAHADSSEYLASLMSSKAGKVQLASVVALFERDYWSRLWVVQEVFNAKDITVHCGSLNIPWSVCRLASDVFWKQKGNLNYYFPGGSTIGGQRTAPSQFTYSQVLAYHGPSSIPDVSSFSGLGEESLLHVMRVCRRKLSADPKDKLYGILGLLDEEIRNEFPVDYSLSVKEVYVRVFDYLLCTTERLDILCEAVHFPLHTSSNFPSWVPEWSHNPETTALGRSCDFSAAGSTKAEARVLDDRRRLEMSALFLDTISAHGIAVGTLCTLADYIMAFLHWRALLLGSSKDGESQERQEEFCRTLSLDQTPADWNVTNESRSSRSWKIACYHVFASLAHDRLPRLLLDNELWRYVDVDIGIEREDRRRFLQDHFGARMMGRCFCLTEDGLIGLGSGFMAAGDLVVIPLGCPTPILIRPEGPRGEYRYVGDVYVHGYMHGEAVDHWKSGEREVRKYVLH
jgi:hypothetical protein